MTHVLDALGRIKEYWGSVALADLDDYARGRIIRGGAVDYEAYAAETLGAVLIGDGVDIVSDTTPTFVDLVTMNAGLTFGGATGVNVITIPDNLADALNIVDDGAGDVFFKIITTTGSEEVIFNDGEDDVDFRVAASGVTNAVFIEGSTANVSIGATPSTRFDIYVPAGSNPTARLRDGDVSLPDYTAAGFIPALTSDTIGQLGPNTATQGGISLSGWAENVANVSPIVLGAHLGSNSPTAAAVVAYVFKHNGLAAPNGNRMALAAGEKAFEVSNAGIASLLMLLAGPRLGVGTATPGSITEWNVADQDLELVDGHNATAVGNIIDVWEVQTGGGTGYIAVYDGFTP